VKQPILSGMDYPGDRPYVYEADVNSSTIALVAGCWWGGPQTAMVVEELACIGVEYIIGFGLAGSISRDVRKHAHIVALRGLVTDGTSRAYTKASFVDADDKLLRMLLSLRHGFKEEIAPTVIATVDAIYQETDAAVQEWTNLGAQAINMETTPLYAASVVSGTRSLWLGYISDRLLDNEWDDWSDCPDSLDRDSADMTVALLESLVSELP
jgi:uridine phosphorylase